MSRIYLDNNATTPMDPAVKQVIVETLSLVGNPSSVHRFGQEVRNRIALARRFIASYFGVLPQEVLFNSGATEGMNFLLRGFFAQDFRGHLITSDVEHSCVTATVEDLGKRGVAVTMLPAGEVGAVSVDRVAEAIRSDTRCLVLMAANNETGVRTDIAAIADLAASHRIPFFVDGVALLGKETMTLPYGVTGIVFSGHKVHAPAGIGCTILRKACRVVPWQTGGGQEYGLRGGTENVLGILSFAEALRSIQRELPQAAERMRALRNRLETNLQGSLEDVLVNGTGPRVSNTTSLSFPGVDGESLLLNLDLLGVAVSHGSACSSGALEPSRVFHHMGFGRERASTAIRFSLSRMTTEEEIDRASQIVIDTAKQIKRSSLKIG